MCHSTLWYLLAAVVAGISLGLVFDLVHFVPRANSIAGKLKAVSVDNEIIEDGWRVAWSELMVKEKVRNELYVCGNIDKQSSGTQKIYAKQTNERANERYCW